MDYTKKIFSGSVLVVIGKVTALALTLISTILLARLLGPYDYGLLSLGLAIMFTAYLFTDLGIGAAATYYLPRGFNEYKLLSLLTKWKLLIIFAVIGVLFLSAEAIAGLYRTDSLAWITRFFAIGLVFYATNLFVQQVVQGYRRFRLFMTVDITLAVTRYVPLAAVFLGFGLFGAVYGFVIAYALTALTATAGFFWNVRVKRVGQMPETPALVRYSMFNFLGFAFYMLYNLATNLIVGYFLPAEAVGFFTLAWQAGNYTILLVPVALGTSLWPTLSEMHIKKQELNESFRRITRYMFYAAFPLAVGLAMFSQQAVSILFGNEYLGAASVLSVMSLAFLLQGCAAGIESLMLGVGQPKLVTWKNGLQAIANIVLSIVLIPIFGVVGAGFSFLIVTTIGVFMLNYWALKEYRFRYPFRALLKAIVASLTMAVVLSILNSALDLVPMVLVGGAVYLGTLVLLRGIDARDIEMVGLKKYLSFLVR